MSFKYGIDALAHIDHVLLSQITGFNSHKTFYCTYVPSGKVDFEPVMKKMSTTCIW